VISGSVGRVEIEIPFNAPPDRPCRIFVEDAPPGAVPDRQVVELPVCDQYTIQGDLFSHAVRQGKPAPYPLEDSVRNMRVIDALFRSGRSGGWESI
jgi:predicted dehydrogenase